MTGLPFSLRALRGVPRLFVTAFLVVMSLGYAAGVYFVDFTTHASPAGTVHQFRGNENVPLEEAGEIKYPKGELEMLNIIHTHVTSFALIFFGVGGVFLASGVPRRLKGLLAVEPFVGTVLLFGGMAGLHYLPEAAARPLAWLMMATGFFTAACFFAMVAISLWELWGPRATPAAPGTPP